MEELKRCIEKATEFMDRVAGITDEVGTVLYSTDEMLVGTVDSDAVHLLKTNDNMMIGDHKCLKRLSDPGRADFICYVDGTDTVSLTYLEFLSNWLLTALHDSVRDVERKVLIKNILLENELPGDIPLKAKEHYINYAVPRVVYIVRVAQVYATNSSMILQEMFPNKRNDFILTVDGSNIVIVKQLKDASKKKIAEIAEMILNTLKSSGIETVHLGIGMLAETLRDCARSYREASLALMVGDTFDKKCDLMYYNKLGLGRLIYQLPTTLCRMFLDEVFPHDSYDELDDETLLTIDKFFENNLNGSETSRQLFVHRNTLVYRLDKVQKTTDLDLRNFDDAVLFKLASMVRQYLEKQDPSLLNRSSYWKRQG